MLNELEQLGSLQSLLFYLMRSRLRVKLASLVEEVQIIRTEEQRVRRRLRSGISGQIADDLKQHREGLRAELRSANLAYGYLRQQPYRAMESKCRVRPDVKRILAILRSLSVYGRTRQLQVDEGSLEAWLDQ